VDTIDTSDEPLLEGRAMAAFRPSCSSEISSSTSSTPLIAPSFQRAERRLVGRITLGVRNLHGEDPPEAVVLDHRDEGDTLAHDSM
jgi:hypothetical protein